MSNLSAGIQERRQQNMNKTCEHHSCNQPRRGLSRYCSYHEGRQQRYGHPDGYHLKKGVYEYEQEEVKDFIERHLEHEAIRAAVSWFDQWMSDAALEQRVPGQREFRNLFDHGVTGRLCLEVVMGVWLYSFRRTSALPHDRQFDFSLALAVLSLAPREKISYWTNGEPQERSRHVGYRSRRDIGRNIRETLYTLSKNIQHKLDDELYQRDVKISSLAIPF